MPALESALDAVFVDAHRAVDEMLRASAGSGAAWATPPAAGKWSAREIVEHVAIAIEESARVAAGEPSKFPTLPAFLRPIIRGLFFNRILKNGAFPKARAPKSLHPARVPATPADARARLEGALARLEQACRARAAAGLPVDSPTVGVVPIADFARFQTLHTRHHTRQIVSRPVTPR
jgi:hypothetical protein